MGIRTRRARSHSKTHFVGFSLAGALGFIALLCVTLALSLGAVVSTWLEDLPDYTSADAFLVAEPTRVFDADGNEVVAYYLQNRRSVELDQISDYVKKGTIDTEDKRFYQHNGVDPEGIARAAVGQVFGGGEQGGGSTITQQLVRWTVLSDEQFENSLRRKVREAYIAIQMEKEYTKDQILNMYLNVIYYGNGAYGIEAASITYFNKHANELTLAEAALLLATAPKSNSVVMGIDRAMADVRRGKYGPPPRELQNVHADGAGFEREQGYKYPHDFPNHWVEQQYLPDALVGTRYYVPGENKNEQAAKAYWDRIKGEK